VRSHKPPLPAAINNALICSARPKSPAKPLLLPPPKSQSPRFSYLHLGGWGSRLVDSVSILLDSSPRPAIKAGTSRGHRSAHQHSHAALCSLAGVGVRDSSIPSYWRIACGGTKHEAGTALFARKSQNQLEDHTCGFLASCAVVASSLLPPFARATSKIRSILSF